ncbi:MAG: 1-phosphofructokinase family hexose kinase [Caldilineales bacterium]|nr:1-phosphofructokinase family hexose kinase [Caldilineales bacterium]
MAMIYTVTLNPTLDKTLSVPQLRPGEVHRAEFVRQDIGGKGINVSRALRLLGIESTVIAIFAGATGETMRRGLEAAGFVGNYVWAEGETRQNITLRDDSANLYTKINEPGPLFRPEHLDSLLSLITSRAKADDIWAFCGSLPPGAPNDLYAQLITEVQRRGGRAFLDASDAALRAGVLARPFAVKPNSEEAALLVGRLPVDDDDHCDAAIRLGESGVALVALSRGADGLVLALDGETILATPPTISARSPIGAGDATLAGLIWAVRDGCDAPETARRATACGTAAAMQEGTGLGDLPLINELKHRIQLSPCPRTQ